MILVRKKYLYILTILFCVLLVFGEVKFFFAIHKAKLADSLDIKYQVENFIFASVLLVLIVYLFLVNFIKTSTNVLKKMDKMIELSDYGKHDIGAHLKEIGPLGDKVKYLLFYLNQMNDMKSLKISSLANMNEFLVQKTDETLFLLDYKGEITDCSDKLTKKLDVKKENFTGKMADEIFDNITADEVFRELERSRTCVTKEGVKMKTGHPGKPVKVIFYPVFNAENTISHIIGIIEDTGRQGFGLGLFGG